MTHAYESRMNKEEQQNPSGLTLSERAVLMVLGQFISLNSRQLSDIMDINPGTISVYVQRLITKNLIQKVQDQDDRRNWLLNLTKIGQNIYQEIIAGTVSYTQDFLSTLSENDQRSLHQLLLKPLHNLGFDWVMNTN
ncbi:MarR family winged helix-turn-helix transcriptional regulator [Promethearchaeum syntrophicum]|uniref:MarR family winged helix-turn-helix transcriptional regulator n=1 Tax=Promethearchaeum syntrophicum TaxID=2594042 RepID=A0A5B9DE04_9ARCH|nr:MarR family transcriptional regulator [Candidatus Prometheoarchaeum syntrophicum]